MNSETMKELFQRLLQLDGYIAIEKDVGNVNDDEYDWLHEKVLNFLSSLQSLEVDETEEVARAK